jgi:hypothetical protein
MMDSLGEVERSIGVVAIDVMLVLRLCVLCVLGSSWYGRDERVLKFGLVFSSSDFGPRTQN